MPPAERSAPTRGYAPVPLDKVWNSGVAVLGDSMEPPLGDQQLHGLPFAIGSDPARCLVALGQGSLAPVEIELRARAYKVIVLHRLIHSEILAGGPVGLDVADYIFRFSDGTEEHVPIRDRFEIAVLPRHGEISTYGHHPFRARTDRKPILLNKDEAPNALAGYHQPQAQQPSPAGYYLFTWTNPHPELELARVTVVPEGPLFVIAAITLGQLDEEPFPREPARPVIIELAHPEDVATPFAVSLAVDRGVATPAFQLPSGDAKQFLDATVAGFGDAPHDGSSPAFAYVAATPSAVVSVALADEPRAEIRWGDLEAQRSVEDNGVRIRVVERGRNWVRTQVVDDATGEPIPCRIHFRSADGIPYQPHGHHALVRTDLSTWHADVGGDVRLGQASYAYIDGTCEGWLPRGDVLVDVARGFEYEPVRERLSIEPDQQGITLRLKRWCDLRNARWFSGDSHVHFLSTQGGHLEAQGEDLSIVNLLLSQWGQLFSNSEEFTGGPNVSADGRTIVYASQENRQHFLGHLTLLGLKRQVMPWSSDGPSEAELGGSLETTLSHWADACHEQGGTVLLPHFPIPNGEPAALIATGRADAVEFIVQDARFHSEYYRYLNCGYRLPLAGGTDKMSAEVPVGLYRTFVHIPDEEFSYESWCRGLGAGRTFMSGGPIVSLTVDGKDVGDTVHIGQGGGTVEVEAWAESIFPISSLELVQEGRVVASTEVTPPTRRLELREQLRVSGHTWFAARVGSGSSYFESTPHYDAWNRRVMAHTSPIYVACGGDWELFDTSTAQYMLTLVNGSLAHIREMAVLDAPGTATHHHGLSDHLAFLEEPFHEAAEAIHRRLHHLGIRH